MSSPLAIEPTAPSDAELIALVRGGDAHAYGELFERHRESALRLARQLVPSADADDLVSEAFIKVLRVLSDGGGPDVAFRPYLLTAVRRLHVDRIRSQNRVTPTDEMDQFDPGVPFADPAVADFENGAAAKAFASLPERWQMVLWHLEVEGQKPADVAPLLGMSANSVSALAYRAREGLRQAYLQMHLTDTAQEDCRWVTERLGAHVRGGLSKRDAAKVDEHLDQCPRCAAVYVELAEVNSNLRAIIGPLLLGTAAAGYLASTGSAAGTAGVIGAWLWRVKETVSANAGLSGSVAASTVVAAGVATVMVLQSPDSGRQNLSEVPVAGAPSSQSAPADDDPTSSGSDPGGPSGTGPNRPGVPLVTMDLNSPGSSGLPTSGLAPSRGGDGATSPGQTGGSPGTTAGSTTGPGTGTSGPSGGPSTGGQSSTVGPTTSTSTSSTTGATTSTTSTTSQPPTSTTTTSKPPPTTTTTTTTNPPGPPIADLAVSELSLVRSQGPWNYQLRFGVSAPDQPVSVSVSVTMPSDRRNKLQGLAGWSCSRLGDTTYSCSRQVSGDVSSLLRVHFGRKSDQWVTVSVDSSDVRDPDSSNNSRTWS